jgi:AraC-like DNA-binding protein
VSLTTARVLDTLAGRRAADAPTAEEMARLLALSPRSLHRRLADAGTTYQRLVDELRRDEALRLFSAGMRARSIKAIAEAVGFADVRGFRRAFKRWTGVTPQQFRYGAGTTIE